MNKYVNNNYIIRCKSNESIIVETLKERKNAGRQICLFSNLWAQCSDWAHVWVWTVNTGTLWLWFQVASTFGPPFWNPVNTVSRVQQSSVFCGTPKLCEVLFLLFGASHKLHDICVIVCPHSKARANLTIVYCYFHQLLLKMWNILFFEKEKYQPGL